MILDMFHWFLSLQMMHETMKMRGLFQGTIETLYYLDEKEILKSQINYCFLFTLKKNIHDSFFTFSFYMSRECCICKLCQKNSFEKNINSNLLFYANHKDLLFDLALKKRINTVFNTSTQFFRQSNRKSTSTNILFFYMLVLI